MGKKQGRMTSIFLDQDIWAEIEKIKKEEGVTLSWLIRKLLKAHFNIV